MTENEAVSNLQRNRRRTSKGTIYDGLSKAVSHFRILSFALTALCFLAIVASTSGTWLWLLFVFVYGLGLLCHIPADRIDRLIVHVFGRPGNFRTADFFREVRPAITASRFSLTIVTAAGFSSFSRAGLLFLIVVIGLLSAAADLTASDKSASEGINS